MILIFLPARGDKQKKGQGRLDCQITRHKLDSDMLVSQYYGKNMFYVSVDVIKLTLSWSMKTKGKCSIWTTNVSSGLEIEIM